MARPRREWDYEREQFGSGLRAWILLLDRLRRECGFARGLSQNDFARDAGVTPAKLSYAIAGTHGRGLEPDERDRILVALERQARWTAAQLGHPLSRRDLLRGSAGVLITALTSAPPLLDFATLRRLAGLPEWPDPAEDRATWLWPMEQGDAAARHYQWTAAHDWYTAAATAARVAGQPAVAALASARSATALLELHDYDRLLTPVNAALHDLDAARLAPDTLPARSALAATLPDDTALEAYAVLARVCAYRWHVLGAFGPARRAAQAGVHAGLLRQGVSYDQALADAYHFLAKARIEEVVLDPPPGKPPGLHWRTPHQHPGWRWTIQQALANLAQERRLRPPNDAAGFGHSWRNTARALRVLLAGTTDRAGQRAIAAQVTEAMRQASRYTRLAVASGPPDPLVALYLDQARWAAESHQDTRRVLRPLRHGIELAVATGALAHASWGWYLEARTLAETRPRHWARQTNQALVASLAAWSDPFESRDSVRTVHLALHLDPELASRPGSIHTLFETHAAALDPLSLTPGFDPEASLQQAIIRLHPTAIHPATTPWPGPPGAASNHSASPPDPAGDNVAYATFHHRQECYRADRSQ